jgi:hypothetical protein
MERVADDDRCWRLQLKSCTSTPWCCAAPCCMLPRTFHSLPQPEPCYCCGHVDAFQACRAAPCNKFSAVHKITLYPPASVWSTPCCVNTLRQLPRMTDLHLAVQCCLMLHAHPRQTCSGSCLQTASTQQQQSNHNSQHLNSTIMDRQCHARVQVCIALYDKQGCQPDCWATGTDNLFAPAVLSCNSQLQGVAKDNCTCWSPDMLSPLIRLSVASCPRSTSCAFSPTLTSRTDVLP